MPSNQHNNNSFFNVKLLPFSMGYFTGVYTIQQLYYWGNLLWGSENNASLCLSEVDGLSLTQLAIGGMVFIYAIKDLRPKDWLPSFKVGFFFSGAYKISLFKWFLKTINSAITNIKTLAEHYANPQVPKPSL